MYATEQTIDNVLTITHHIHFNNSNALEDRLRANKCELCGNTDVPLEIHHINKLKNLSEKEQWERAMIARKRKTLVVCLNCHIAIHHSS